MLDESRFSDPPLANHVLTPSRIARFPCPPPAMLAPCRASGQTLSTASRILSTAPRDRSSCTKSRHRHPLPHHQLRRKPPFVGGRLLPQLRGRLTHWAGLRVQLQQHR